MKDTEHKEVLCIMSHHNSLRFLGNTHAICIKYGCDLAKSDETASKEKNR